MVALQAQRATNPPAQLAAAIQGQIAAIQSIIAAAGQTQIPFENPTQRAAIQAATAVGQANLAHYRATIVMIQRPQPLRAIIAAIQATIVATHQAIIALNQAQIAAANPVQIASFQAHIAALQARIAAYRIPRIAADRALIASIGLTAHSR